MSNTEYLPRLQGHRRGDATRLLSELLDNKAATAAKPAALSYVDR